MGIMNEAFLSSRRKRMVSVPAGMTRELIIDFLKEYNQFDYNVAELARALDYKFNTIKYHIYKMVKDGSLVEIRYVSNGITYQLPEWFTDKRRKEVEKLNDVDT